MGYRNGEFVLTHQPDPQPKPVTDSTKKRGTGQTSESRKASDQQRAINRLVSSRAKLTQEVARLRASRDELSREVDSLREEVESLEYKKKSFS